MSGAGVGEAFGLQEKESAWRRFWRYVAYTWTIGRNILTFWLVYLAFGRMESVFQKLVLAGVVLILQSVSDSNITIARGVFEEALLHRKLFLGLYKKFDRNSVESDERELDKRIAHFHKSDGPYLINTIANLIIYLYVIWQVIQILVLS